MAFVEKPGSLHRGRALKTGGVRSRQNNNNTSNYVSIYNYYIFILKVLLLVGNTEKLPNNGRVISKNLVLFGSRGCLLSEVVYVAKTISVPSCLSTIKRLSSFRDCLCS